MVEQLQQAPTKSLFASVKRVMTTRLASKALVYRRSIASVPSGVDKGLHVVEIREKNWISKIEPPEAAAVHLQNLYLSMLEALAQSCALDTRGCMLEAAQLLLEWYRSKHLRLSKTVYLHVLTTLCVQPDPMLAADALHTLSQLSLEQRVLPAELWLKHPNHFNYFVAALGHPSATTVSKCAVVLAWLLEVAETSSSTNLFALLNPASIAKINSAFTKWHAVYAISDGLERVCASLYCLQMRMRVGRVKLNKQPSKAKQLVDWLVTTVARPSVTIISQHFSHRRSTSSAHVLPKSMGRASRTLLSGLVRNATMRLHPPTPSTSFPAVVEPGVAPTPQPSVAKPPMTSQELLSQHHGALVRPRLSRLRTVRGTMKGKKDHDHFTFVTPETMSEIQRRRSVRRKFEDLLRETQTKYDAVVSLKGDRLETERRRPDDLGVMDGYSKLLALYSDAEDCALRDFVATALSPQLRAFFFDHVQPFGASLHITHHRWFQCWLTYVPILLLITYWLAYGLYMLQRDAPLARLLQFDVSRIHDPVAQGIAIALSQRKNSSERRSNLQHNMKLCAMWAEWPSLTYAPLAVAFKVAKTDGFVRPAIFSFNFNDLYNVATGFQLGRIVIIKFWKRAPARLGRMLVRQSIYPITFDVLYIPITSTLLRVAICPNGDDRIVFLASTSCDCVDRYGVVWAVGSFGFILIYSCAVYYKMYIEPLATTMDFRFETSFQITMVMARTRYKGLPQKSCVVNPLLSLLADSVGLESHGHLAIPMTLAFLGSLTFLLITAYKMQPCIGSGRIANNIRVLSFSSSSYTTLCVLGFLVSQSSITNLYVALSPLPIVWATAWSVNDRRARLFHIPRLTILELLQERATQAKTVGAIAALHANPVSIPEVDHEAIVSLLHKTVRLARTGELHCRLYAARLLWFCHIESFRKAKTVVGECGDDDALPPKLWFKDLHFYGRTASQKPGLTKSRDMLQQLKHVKIRRIEVIGGPVVCA
ncbi:hypothetical protein ACHHYP_02822 [Achlya hypogyna]|uniref:Transmembrane protein n=1 Tax=Achlya hypogyna TaxID=1202772 RepID=A0A1V9ZRT6_ACHHY|nr:hypothetical protein ACHHYP_02822 [Achlya hypogyna]